MKYQIYHTGRVRNGKTIFDNVELYQQNLLELEGKEFSLIIKEKHKKPSNNQYGYYRGGILPVCYESEHFINMDKKDDIHEYYFAPKFLSYKKLVVIGGQTKEVSRVRSLADLSNKEMSEFIERVISDCYELGIEVMPAESFYNKYYQK